MNHDRGSLSDEQSRYPPNNAYSSAPPYPPVPASQSSYTTNSTPGYPDPRYYQTPGSPPVNNANQIPIPRYDGPGVPPPPPSQPTPQQQYGNPLGSPSPQYDPNVPHQQAAPRLYSAIGSAFESSAAATQVPDDVISQITEQVRAQVIDSLRSEFSRAQGGPLPPGLQSPVPQPPYPSVGVPSTSIPMPPQMPSQTPFPVPPLVPQQHSGYPVGSPAGSVNSVPVRSVHTPPTPNRMSDSEDSQPFDGAKNADRDNESRAWTSTKDMQSSIKEDLRGRTGEVQRDESSRERPAPSRTRTGDDETVVEKMWQPLFDNGQPTTRLNQFLRGIALHLVDEFEPRESLVIGPMKMKRFYDKMKVPGDGYPWPAIFALPPDKLSSVYSALSCRHHLISPSSSPYTTPSLPALTPHGFAAWMTHIILSHPQKEFERLAIVVRDWPVSNADNRKERLPKELSRRLFPKSDSEPSRRRIADALGRVGIPVNPSFPPPPPPGQPPGGSVPRSAASAPPHNFPPPPAQPIPNHGSQHRGSFTPAPSSSIPTRGKPVTVEDEVDESDTTSGDEPVCHPPAKTSVPIERERKPYIGKEGSGKIHESLKGTVPSGGAPPGRESTKTNTNHNSNPNPIPIPIPSRKKGEESNVASSASSTEYGPGHASLGRQPSTRKRTDRTQSPTHNSSQGYGRASSDVDATGAAASYYDERGHRGSYAEDDSRYRDDRDRYADRGGGDLARMTTRERAHEYARQKEREALERERIERERTRRGRDLEEEERERERRYRAYDEEYRNGVRDHGHAHGGHSHSSASGGGYPPGGSSYVGGNPPLGTGERRY